MKLLFLTVILVTGWCTGLASRIVCYYYNQVRYGSDPFFVENIDPSLCTHIVYTYYGLDENSRLISRDSWNDLGDDWNKGGLERLLNLKKKNPSVKLLIGVGGWHEGPLPFINMVSDSNKRKVFLESSLQFLRTFKFDGLEIDWLYADQWGGSEAAKQGYSQLVKEIKPVFEKSGYLLSIATFGNELVLKNSYDIATLSKYVDYISVLSYNYHDTYEKITNHGAPLYGSDKLNVNDTITTYINTLGAIPEKLNLGVVGYGISFTLKTANRTGYNSEAIKPGRNATLPYRAFCVQDKKGVWTKFYNAERRVPYSVAGDQWVGQEDVQSLTEKVKYAKSKKLGGISFWALEGDDFRGNCDSAKFPLLRAVRTEFLK